MGWVPAGETNVCGSVREVGKEGQIYCTLRTPDPAQPKERASAYRALWVGKGAQVCWPPLCFLCSEPVIGRPHTPCLKSGVSVSFPVALIKYPVKNSLVVKRFILVYSLRVQSEMAGSQGNRNLNQPVTLHPQSGNRDECMLLLSSPSPFYTVQDSLTREWPCP